MHQLVLLFSLTIFGLALVAGTTSADRTFSLKATSRGAYLIFMGNQNSWFFDLVTVCRPLEIPDFRTKDNADAQLCSKAAYSIEDASDTAIRWSDGDEIEVTLRRSGALQLRLVSSSQQNYPNDTLFVIPSEVWTESGALAFQAVLRVGGAMASGSRDYLVEASWQALQSGFWTSIFRDTTEVVKSGELLPGASVDFIAPKRVVTSFGHITPPSQAERAFQISALTERADISLRASYFGLEAPSVFKPDWIDEISSSTIIVSLAVMMSLIAAVIEVAGGLGARTEKRDKK